MGLFKRELTLKEKIKEAKIDLVGMQTERDFIYKFIEEGKLRLDNIDIIRIEKNLARQKELLKQLEIEKIEEDKAQARRIEEM